MSRHLEALYVHDERGRMAAVNQWDGGTVPRFHLSRTTEGALCRVRSDLPDALAAALTDWVRREPTLAGLDDPPAHAEVYARLLEEHAPIESVGSGPVYRFPSLRPGPDPAVVPIDEANSGALRRYLSEWLPDVPHRRPFFALLDDGHAVATCASVRITPRAHEAGVETAERYRGRGHASRVVAVWAAAVQAAGAEPLYSTSWENRASRGVAERLRLEPIGADLHLT